MKFLMAISFFWLALAAGAQTRKFGPSLKETEHWMQNTLNNSGAGTLYVRNKESAEERTWNMPFASSCEVSFEYRTGDPGVAGFLKRVDYEAIYKFNLKDIDPSSIKLVNAGSDIIGPKSIVMVGTKDDANLITLEFPRKVRAADIVPIPSNSLLFEFGSPYAKRFVRAFRHAVVLCGGKPSSF